jgi:hypothetical protein
MFEYVRMDAERDHRSDCVAFECTLGTDGVFNRCMGNAKCLNLGNKLQFKFRESLHEMSRFHTRQNRGTMEEDRGSELSHFCRQVEIEHYSTKATI